MRVSKVRGFTLVEALFTMLIVIVAGLGILGAYGSSINLIEVAQQSSVAVNHLKDMMERIKSTAFTQLNTDFPNGAANGVANSYVSVVGGYSLPTEQITVTHQPDTLTDPRELSAQLTWTNRGRVYQKTLSTIRASKAS